MTKHNGRGNNISKTWRQRQGWEFLTAAVEGLAEGNLPETFWYPASLVQRTAEGIDFHAHRTHYLGGMTQTDLHADLDESGHITAIDARRKEMHGDRFSIKTAYRATPEIVIIESLPAFALWKAMVMDTRQPEPSEQLIQQFE